MLKLDVIFSRHFQKLYKRFFNTASGREKGTLYHIKVLIERSNVNGKVKSHFEVSLLPSEFCYRNSFNYTI